MSVDAGLALHPRVGAAFYGRFPALHPAQAAALEPLLAGRNVVLSAGTGSGKTEAVVVPLVSRGWMEALRDDQTFILYICPTKALINDVAGRLRAVLDALGIRVAIRHGDRNDLALASKAHVLITTPESLGVLIKQQEPSLREVRGVVIDEVHLLYNTQRGLQLAVLLHRLKRLARTPFQWAALSATVANLAHIREFFFGSSESAELLAFPATRTIEAQIRALPTLGELRTLVARLMEAPRRKLLLFANSRRGCEEIAGLLQSEPSLQGAVFTHYSSLSTELREETERQFAAAARAICVATSTLEMGIDIGDIDAVVLHGAPSGVESFLQRIGRGNRRSNQTNVLCLPTVSDGAVRETLIFATLVRLARAGCLAKVGPRRLYGALGQQCLSVIEQHEGRYTRVQELCEEVGAFSYSTRPVIESILAELASNEYCQRHGFKNRYGASDAFWELVDQGSLISNFPKSSNTVDLRHGKRLLGSVPRQNLIRVRPGVVLRFAGRNWRVVRIEQRSLEVESAQGRAHDIDLSFGGAGRSGLDAFLAQQLWHTLFSITNENGDLEAATWGSVEPQIAAVRAVCGEGSLPHARTPSGFRHFTFGGLHLNKVLAVWSGASQVYVTDISVEIDRILDLSTLPSSPAELLPVARGLFTQSDSQTFFQQQLPMTLQLEEWCEEWLADTAVAAALDRLRTSVAVEVTDGSFGFLEPPRKRA